MDLDLTAKIGRALVGGGPRSVSKEECVGYVEMQEDEFEEVLREIGFEENPPAYWKCPPWFCDEYSWRLLDGERQIHVILEYDGTRGVTDIYANFEWRWDERPLKHAFGRDRNPSKGVNRVRSELNRQNIEWGVEWRIKG